MNRWFDAQLVQKILDGIYCTNKAKQFNVVMCGVALLHTVAI